MNAWDFVTWLSSIALAISAVAIFVFFLRDARSILSREMHGHDEEEPTSSSASGSAAGAAEPAPPEDHSR
jgi:hypothetical protein